MLYPENTSTGNDIFFNVDGERKTIGFLFSFPERFEPNQLVYIDGNVNVYENDIIRYIDEDGEDTDFEQ